MTSRRTFLASLAAATTLRGAETQALLDDTRFERGLGVLKSRAGVRNPAGTISPSNSSRKPVWSAAQWYSHFNLAAAKRQMLSSGSSRFFDGAKAVTFGVRTSPEADLILALNGHAEYGDHAPAQGQPWPHLLVEQSLTHSPKLPALKCRPLPCPIPPAEIAGLPFTGLGRASPHRAVPPLCDDSERQPCVCGLRRLSVVRRAHV